MTTPANDRKPPRKKKKLKKIELEAKAQRKGEILAEYAAHKKKPWMESLKEHLGHWIDNIDPLELMATLGLTVLVKGTIDTTQVLAEKMKKASKEELPWWVAVIVPAAAPYVLAPLIGAKLVEKSGVEIGEIPEWLEWLISFCIAYIIIKHGGQLLGLMKEGGGTLTSVIGALMGVAA